LANPVFRQAYTLGYPMSRLPPSLTFSPVRTSTPILFSYASACFGKVSVTSFGGQVAAKTSQG
jgi:hypothetical protein